MTRTSTRTKATALAVLAALGLALTAIAAAPAGAAGITTHSWMATSAVDKVEIGELRALLKANIGQVYAGAQFPDSGYIPNTGFGEEAHWQRFFDAYAEVLRTKPGCGDLTAPTGPCAAGIAHLMGSIAHGMGDEVWDWLFEPLSADLDEYFVPAELAGIANEGGQELQLDLVALTIFGRVNPPAPPIPSTADVLAALDAAGFDGATEGQLLIGQVGQSIIHDVEAGWAPQYIARLLKAMPYMSANLVTEPGGVEFAATAIVGEWENMWGRLLGDQPPTEVSITYPADEQRRIPATGWERESFQPGSARDRGGARNRVTAVLTYSAPYVPAEGGPSVPALLPEGSMTLTEVESGDAVAVKDGFPKLVPYGPDAGEHVVDIQPAKDLAPCTWYEAGVTDKLLDANGEGVTPYEWTFRTGPKAGGRCDDDPLTAEENWVVGTYEDLFGRAPSAADVAAWTYRLDRAFDRKGVAGSLVGSAEHRRRLVAEAYQSYLGRAPEAGGLAFWTARTRANTLTDLRARLVGSNEVYAAAGGTDEAFVTAAYDLVLGRAPDDAGLAHWTAELDRGVARSTLARRLLLSPEAIRAVVVDTYQRVLDRAPTTEEQADGSAVVRAGDERRLIATILATDEHLEQVQPA